MLKIKIMNLVKCSVCKKEKTPDMFIGTKGQKLKTCLKCRERAKKSKLKTRCPHGKRKDKCKDCGGIGICIHNKEKRKCRDCKGSDICIHNRDKYYCRDCGGRGYCIHDIEKAKCREGCGGSKICIHDRRKVRCKECGGSSICIHNKLKNTCKYCDPKGYLRYIVSSRIKMALKAKKSKKSFEYLGCNIEFYKTHIEKQFTEGMTWDNMGEWEIDHITPIMYNKPSMEEVIERLHWSNTQPLWKADNMAKGNRWIG